MAATTKEKTILLMDDEVFNIQWLIDFLEAKGFDVIALPDAEGAKRSLRRFIEL